MNLKLKVLVVILCGLFLSGCVVSKTKLDESMAKCTLLENDLRSKEQDLAKNNKEISTITAANKALIADAEKAKQLSNEELAKIKAVQEQTDAEMLKIKEQIVEKNKELLAFKDEMSRKLLEKDKETEDVVYKVREIQSRAEALLEKIKLIK